MQLTFILLENNMIIIERILSFLLVYAIIGAVFMWYKSKNKDE